VGADHHFFGQLSNKRDRAAKKGFWVNPQPLLP
jgi:hypothetical protein